MTTAIGSLLVVLVMSLLVTRIAAMALRLTGMSSESAAFQARSAFTGVGFTTGEAEEILAHPVRRRIIMLLMLLGNLGVGAVVATLILSVNEARSAEGFVYLVIGLFGIWIFARSRFVERRLNRVIAWALLKLGSFKARDYIAVLQLENGYAVSELAIEKSDWLADKSLFELRLPAEGVLILGIRRSTGSFIGTPVADTVIRAGDVVTVYGPTDRIAELDQRRQGHRGDVAHEEAVEEHEEVLVEQEKVEATEDSEE